MIHTLALVDPCETLEPHSVSTNLEHITSNHIFSMIEYVYISHKKDFHMRGNDAKNNPISTRNNTPKLPSTLSTIVVKTC